MRRQQQPAVYRASAVRFLGKGYTIKPINDDYIGALRAMDPKTGKEMWKFQTGSGVVAPPVTWQEGGTQYVAVVSGWGCAVPLWDGEVAREVNFLEQGGSVWVFKLSSL